jgi:hypothetical protein
LASPFLDFGIHRGAVIKGEGQEAFWSEAAPSPQRVLGAGKGLVPEQMIIPARQKGEEYEYRGRKRKGTWIDEKEEEEDMKMVWNYERLCRAREGQIQVHKKNDKTFKTVYKIT